MFKIKIGDKVRLIDNGLTGVPINSIGIVVGFSKFNNLYINWMENNSKYLSGSWKVERFVLIKDQERFCKKNK